MDKIKQLVTGKEQVFGSGGKQRRRGRPPWDAVVMFTCYWVQCTDPVAVLLENESSSLPD